MIKVKNGQDPYSVIGQYIRNHVLAIEDMIAVIEIDGKTSNELFMVDMDEDGDFVWKSDWYEGEENVVLIDFFPVSDACNPKDHWIPCNKKMPEELTRVLVCTDRGFVCIAYLKVHYKEKDRPWLVYGADPDVRGNVIKWMPLPKS